MADRERTRLGSIQLCKSKNAVTLLGYRAGETLFCLKTRRGIRRRATLEGSICTIDGKRRCLLTPGQTARFRAAEEQFRADFCAAQRGEGFSRAEGEGEVRYVRRREQFLYEFIEVHADGSVRHTLSSVPDYFENFFDYVYYGVGADRDEAILRREEALLSGTDDEYLVREVRYLRGEATREDVEYLERADGRQRFFREKEVYGPEEIALIDLRILPRGPLHPSFRYELAVEIGGRRYAAFYRWGQEQMTLRVEGGRMTIPVSSGFRALIRTRTQKALRQRVCSPRPGDGQASAETDGEA